MIRRPNRCETKVLGRLAHRQQGATIGQLPDIGKRDSEAHPATPITVTATVVKAQHSTAPKDAATNDPVPAARTSAEPAPAIRR
jgi:hypothetical protein